MRASRLFKHGLAVSTDNERSRQRRTDVRRAVVLDYLAHGLSDDGRPQYEKSPAGYALDVESFELYQVAFDEDERLTIGNEVIVEPADERGVVTESHRVEYDEPTGARVRRPGRRRRERGAVRRLLQRGTADHPAAPPAESVTGDREETPKRYPRRTKTQTVRELRRAFRARLGLHDPDEILVERILEELRDDDLKYQTFVGQSND